MPLLHRAILGCLLTLLTGAGGCDEAVPAGDVITVPSGREVRFLDVITNVPGAEGATARFRFVAPGLVGGDSTAAADMLALCDSYALPRTTGTVPLPRQIIISLAAAEVPFGEAAPDVAQLFEAYSVAGGACVWEAF